MPVSARPAPVVPALLSLAAFAIVAGPAGCTPGGAADAIRPDTPTAGGATGAERRDPAEPCDPAASYEAMVVDLEPEARGDLEVALKQGVVVVKYDCRSLAILPDCELAGDYGYLGMSRKEKVVSLSSADEIKANLPVSGIKFLADLEAGLTRGQSLNVAMVMVGKRTTARKLAATDELDGDCAGATHFIRDATVGAFAMEAGSSAEVTTAASIFGRGASGASKSSEKVASRDGELEACQAATPDSKAPPGQCQSILRLRLKAIAAAEGAAADRAEVDVASCPPGTVMAGGVCQEPEPDRPHQCKLGDADGCRAMCERGDAPSCYILGSMQRAGLGAGRDLAAAAANMERACEGEVWPACTELAGLHRRKEIKAASLDRAAELAARACDAGHGLGCVEHGLVLVAGEEAGRGAKGKGRAGAEQAVYRFRKACYGGEFEGCAWLGSLYGEGTGGVSRSPKLAAKFLEKACKEGSPLGCHLLAEAVRAGKGTKKDQKRAAELAEKACRGGHQPACR